MSDSISSLEQAFIDVCNELGCAHDNEAALMAIDALKTRVEISENRADTHEICISVPIFLAETPDSDRLPDHPMQPVVFDAEGRLRFRRNHIVEFLLERSGGMNALLEKGFSAEDWAQLVQLNGMSVAGSRGYIAEDILTTLMETKGRSQAIASARPVQARSVQEAVDNFVASLPSESETPLVFIGNRLADGSKSAKNGASD